MAVEATHPNLFTTQLIQNNRDLMNPTNQVTENNGVYGGPQMLFPAIPFAGTLPGNNPIYRQVAVCDSAQAKTSMNTDSGLTYNINPAPRKRSRDSINDQLYDAQNFHATQIQKINNGVSQFPSSFIGEDILPHIQQHHLDIDSIISQHTKKIRLELQQRQKQQARQLLSAIGEGVTKKLKEKDEQISRMSKLNYFLQEKMKSLYVENQLWRDVAQTNEATANSLRSNLEQVLQAAAHGGAAAVEEEVESCCGSNDNGLPDTEAVGETSKDNNKDVIIIGDGRSKSSCYGDRSCRKCGERESCVLLLPCRHLCLCSVCGSGAHQLRACPVCDSSMNATLHVNMSS